MKRLVLVLALFACLPAQAEPTGRWWSGFGQGNLEYGIKNDSAGSDEFYIACMQDRTYISLRIGGVEPKQGQSAIVTIGPDEFEVQLGKDGYVETASHVGYDTFRAWWAAMRAGANMRVRLSTGQSTNFTLKGAAKILPRDACETDFQR
jgi:hypothetical protein